MHPVTLKDIVEKLIEMQSCHQGNYEFTPDNVFQIGDAKNKATIGKILDTFLLPGSRIDNAEALAELYRRSQSGESCLLLAEHYSNFDFPMIYRLVERAPELGVNSAKKLLPMRGMKLSETDLLAAVFTRSYDCIIIYPSRSLDKETDPQKRKEIRKISTPINHAAMREMIKHKHNGRIITVFPAGTRYRPWSPMSRKGVREIHSYLKTFDNVIFMAINGNTLPPHRTDDMLQDKPTRDLMILTCSDIISSRHFRKAEEKLTPEGKDPKQHVVDRVMEKLFTIHDEVEPLRLAEKANL